MHKRDKIETLNKKMEWQQIAVIFLAFTYFGMSENIKGPAIPIIQADFGLSEWRVGLLLAINALGFLIACSFAGITIRKLEAKVALLMALTAMTLSGIFIYFSVSYSAFTAAYFLMYIGNGLIEIVLSVLAARIFLENTVVMMSLSHFCYGVGATIGPMASAGLMNTAAGGPEGSWRFMYIVLLMLGVIPATLCLLTKFPKNETPEHTRLSFQKCFKEPVLWLLAAILTFSVVAELAIAGWLVNLLQKAFDFAPYSASLMLSAFFLLFTVGRLVLGPLIDKIGYTITMILFAGVAGILTIVCVAAGPPFTVLLAIVGLGIAPLYPTVMAYLPRLYPNNTDGAVNFLVVIWAFGSVVGNFLVGAVTDGFVKVFTRSHGVEMGTAMGLKAGFMTIGVILLLCAAFGIVLYRYLKKRDQVL